MVGTRFKRLNLIGGDFLLVFSKANGKFFEFEAVKGALIDDGNLSLKMFFNLKRDVNIFKYMDYQI